MTSKSTGSYYTPQKLAEFIVDHVRRTFSNKSALKVLEPSCGGGVFLQAFRNGNAKTKVFIDAVEKDLRAIKLAKQNISNIENNIKVKFCQDDFLKLDLVGGYDLVVGNPPYIGRKLMTKKQRLTCAKIHENGGLAQRSIKNIWPAFVVKSSSLLNNDGVLALVLPGELLQVNYAKEIREYLERNFQAIEILAFENLVFPALGQDVIVIFAYKSAAFSGIRYSKVSDVEKLSSSVDFVEKESLPTVKWSSFVLDDDEISFLSTITSKVKKVSDYCTSTPGIVTGANNFFIVNKEILEKYKLQSYSKSILQKSSYVGNNVSFSNTQLKELQNKNEPSFLLDLGPMPYNKLSPEIKSYLQLGKKKNVHQGFKCRNRKPWYNIPVVWVPIGVIFKRSHLYPRLIRNDANVLVTDTAYRITPNKDSNIESIIYSFYNSLTLAFCELNGRYYGGGVLELIPSEFKSLPLPFKNITAKEFASFESKFKGAEKIDDLIKENDKVLLSILGLDASELMRLQKIREKLLAHRLRITV